MLPSSISQLPTPCLLIEQATLQRNIERLSSHIGALGCTIRPHVKTHKSVDITKEIVNGGHTKGITVSTLKEAQHFFSAGYTDILYAVGLVPNKFEQVKYLISQGCDIKVILDSVEAARLLQDFTQLNQTVFKVMIELDVDHHRAGVDPHGDTLLEIATILSDAQFCELHGVMTHAGGSYECFDHESQLALARQERDFSVAAAKRIREKGMPCPNVSIGSTPTAFAIDDLTGITEVRAGVYVLFDLVMAGLGVCDIDDIAVSVQGSIIGFQHDKHIALTDAGWMAMSRDRGTAGHKIDQGYGVVCDAKGAAYSHLIMQSANQEHGIIGVRDNNPENEQQLSPDILFSIGDLIRVLPNHACSTAAQYGEFYLVDGDRVIANLPSISGW
ncbi:alanine racemase [Glaciecola sp. XM2]|uniref:alanine racemase n=1 Tax=Glaciecola sp. XM2 TaxID=1914931 RepID=UPI001BDEECEE|nr:alanine racemase [Glaciecola sp. XM2]MBT1450000.1 alanine racemase [Glaciecola sp. XM2]